MIRNNVQRSSTFCHNSYGESRQSFNQEPTDLFVTNLQSSQPKLQTSLARSQSACLRKQTSVDRNSFDQTGRSESSTTCVEEPEDNIAINSVHECYNEVIELYSDSINRHVEAEFDDLQKDDNVLMKLNEIEIRRKLAKDKEVQNEKIGSFLVENLSTRLSPLEVRRYLTFVGELDKVMLLQILLKDRLRVLGKNLTDQEKRKKDKLEKQLVEANKFKQKSDEKMYDIENNIKEHLGLQFRKLFQDFVEIKEELTLEQKASDDLEKKFFRDLENM